MTDIGYLQTKIRELQEKQEELDKKIDDSLEREKRSMLNVRRTIDSKLTEVKDVVVKLITDDINKIYSDKFVSIFQNQADDFNKLTENNKKTFNKIMDDLLKEIAYVRKDFSFLMSIVVSKLKISDEEFKKMTKEYDRGYPLEEIKKELDKLKLSSYLWGEHD